MATPCSGYEIRVTELTLKSQMPQDWDTDTKEFTSDEISYALGKQGSTRIKLEKASHCIIQSTHCALSARSSDYLTVVASA